MDTWASLFDRATSVETSVATIQERLAARRADGASREQSRRGDEERDPVDQHQRGGKREMTGGTAPTRVVADADVLAADLLVGAKAREALDHLRGHGWLALVASDPLLADAAAVIATLADDDLARAWRTRIETERCRVEHSAGDHPALASAIAGDAGHVLTFDERLTSAKTGVTLQRYAISVRTPAAFAAVFDPAAAYEAFVGDSYPGPDADPRE